MTNKIEDSDDSLSIDGTPLSDWIVLAGGDDKVSAFGGNDLITEGLGNKEIDGGTGEDTYIASQNTENYIIRFLSDGFVLIGEGSVVELRNVESLSFSDSTLRLDGLSENLTEKFNYLQYYNSGEIPKAFTLETGQYIYYVWGNDGFSPGIYIVQKDKFSNETINTKTLEANEFGLEFAIIKDDSLSLIRKSYPSHETAGNRPFAVVDYYYEVLNENLEIESTSSTFQLLSKEALTQIISDQSNFSQYDYWVNSSNGWWPSGSEIIHSEARGDSYDMFFVLPISDLNFLTDTSSGFGTLGYNLYHISIDLDGNLLSDSVKINNNLLSEPPVFFTDTQEMTFFYRTYNFADYEGSGQWDRFVDKPEEHLVIFDNQSGDLIRKSLNLNLEMEPFEIAKIDDVYFLRSYNKFTAFLDRSIILNQETKLAPLEQTLRNIRAVLFAENGVYEIQHTYPLTVNEENGSSIYVAEYDYDFNLLGTRIIATYEGLSGHRGFELNDFNGNMLLTHRKFESPGMSLISHNLSIQSPALSATTDTDHLVIEGQNGVVYLLQGDDILRTSVENLTAFLGSGDDELVIESGEVNLWGNDGKDSVIIGESAMLQMHDYSLEDHVLIQAGATLELSFNVADFYTYQGSESISLNLAELPIENLGTLIYRSDAALNLNIFGTNGDDVLFTLDGNDSLYGGLGDDILAGGSGNNHIDGGDGLDIAVFSGEKHGFSIQQDGIGGWSINTNTLERIERLQFKDAKIALDLDAHAGEAVKTLGAFLGPSGITPENVGLVLNLLDNGLSYEDLLAEAIALVFGVDPDGTKMVRHFFKALTGEEAPSHIVSQYGDLVDSGELSRVELSKLVADDEVNLTNIDFVGLSSTGVEYLLTI